MTASEQHAEYAAAHTPTIGKKLRAAIEADVLRRVADKWDELQEAAIRQDEPWSRGYWKGVETAIGELRAQADCIERTTHLAPEGDPR